MRRMHAARLDWFREFVARVRASIPTKASDLENDSGVEGDTLADALDEVRSSAGRNTSEVEELRARVATLESTMTALEARGQ